MKLIATLIALIVGASLACAADREAQKKEDSKKEESKTGDRPGPRD